MITKKTAKTLGLLGQKKKKIKMKNTVRITSQMLIYIISLLLKETKIASKNKTLNKQKTNKSKYKRNKIKQLIDLYLQICLLAKVYLLIPKSIFTALLQAFIVTHIYREVKTLSHQSTCSQIRL